MLRILLGLALATTFVTRVSEGAEFQLQGWKKPANWKCQQIDGGTLTCRSKYPGQSKAVMTLKYRPAKTGESVDRFRPDGSRRIFFAEPHTIHGRTWMDSLHQSGQGTGPLVRSVQTVFLFNQKRMTFELRVEAPEETYQSIESLVNRSVASLRLPR